MSHIDTLEHALAQLPEHERQQVLMRTDTGGCSKAFLQHITDLGLQYSIGFPALGPVKEAIEAIPAQAWRAALDGDGLPRDGAQVAELTAWMPDRVTATRPGPQDWPDGMPVIARRERPHPGAQLRLTDHDGWRITCFATNTRAPGWTLAALEVRHRQLPRPRTGPPLGTRTTAIQAPGRGRTNHPHRPQATAATTPRLALEPTHRDRLDRTATPLTHQPRPDYQDPEKPADTGPETHHARPPTTTTQTDPERSTISQAKHRG